VILETSRLRLREMTVGDLDFVASMLADPEVMRYYPKPLSREESLEWIERQIARYARDGHGLWLAESKDTGAPLGQIALAMQDLDAAREPEIGWLVHRPFWRRGFASEAARAVRDSAFGRWKYEHVISLIRPENMPSRGVAQKLGMRPARETAFHGFRHLVFRLDRGVRVDS